MIKLVVAFLVLVVFLYWLGQLAMSATKEEWKDFCIRIGGVLIVVALAFFILFLIGQF